MYGGLTMSAFDDPNLLANKISIKSVDYLNSLLNNGYEISQINWRSKGGSEGLSLVPTLLLEKGNDKVLADAIEIGEYVLQLKPLGDFKKKKTGFVWVSNTKVYDFLEQIFSEVIYGEYGSPISEARLDVKNPQRVYESLYDWIKNNANWKHKNLKLPQLFYSVCVIGIKDGNASLESYPKDALDLSTIQQIMNQYTTYDNSFAMSFVLLTNKNPNLPKRILVGIIIYDLKARNTACFNIQEVELSLENQNSDVNEKLGMLLTEEAFSLFNKSIGKNNNNIEYKSYLPLPVYTEWYTPLPWFTYLALQPIPIQSTMEYEQRNISIPQFLTFGYTEDYHTGNSFELEPFSLERRGRATCILKFNDGMNNTKLTYVLRFDRSPGETQVHIDYSNFAEGGRESKFIGHHRLDLETIYQFSPALFVAILTAGLFDAHFSTIVETGFKGVRELIARNAAYFYPFQYIFTLEKIIRWFDEEPERYKVLKKVASGEQLTDEERKVANYMHDNFIGVVARENGREGTGFMGDAIIFRLDRNQLHLRIGK